MREFIIENIKAAKEEMSQQVVSKIHSNNINVIQRRFESISEEIKNQVNVHNTVCEGRLVVAKEHTEKSKKEINDRISVINSKHSKDTNYLMSQNSRIELDVK